MPCGTYVGSDLHHRNCGGQVTHAHQIVGGAGQSKYPVHFAHPAMPHLPHQRDGLQPAETFFDPLPLLLADGLTRVPRGAAIDRAASASFQALRHVRRHSQLAALLHQPERVEPLSPPTVRGCVPGSLSIMTSAASRSAVPFAWNTSPSTNQSVAVLHQQIPAVTQLRLLPPLLRASKESGSVLDSWVSFERFCP